MSLARLIQKLELPEEFQELFQSGEEGTYSLTYGPETMDMSVSLEELLTKLRHFPGVVKAEVLAG